MKRSEINRALRDMESMLEKYRFALPPFCHYTPEDWQTKGHDHDEIRDNMLGWDITDYGLGDFNKVGFSLITLRNGNLTMSDKYAKTYAEKLLFIKEGQYSPNHFHWHKMEDIINRGGGIKAGKFATGVFHLYHPENSRSCRDANYERMMQRLRNHSTRAEDGISELEGSADAPASE